MVSVTVIDVREGKVLLHHEGNFNSLGIIRLKLEPNVTFKDQVLVHNGRLVPQELNCPVKTVGIWTMYDHATINLYRRIPEQIINVQVVLGERIFLQCEISSTETVLALKNKISEKKTLHPHRQMLESHRLPMLDNCYLDEYIIEVEMPPTFYLKFAPPNPRTSITVILVIPVKEVQTEMRVDVYDDPDTLYLMAIEECLVDGNDEAQQEYYFTDDKNSTLPLRATFLELGIKNGEKLYLIFGEEDD